MSRRERERLTSYPKAVLTLWTSFTVKMSSDLDFKNKVKEDAWGCSVHCWIFFTGLEIHHGVGCPSLSALMEEPRTREEVARRVNSCMPVTKGRQKLSFHWTFLAWSIPGYWLQFPVLYSRTLLFIHYKCKSLHPLTPNLTFSFD